MGPANNAAERALRHAVGWRPTGYGTDSAGGSRFVERVPTVVATCRQQGRCVLESLTACCRACGGRGGRSLPFGVSGREVGRGDDETSAPEPAPRGAPRAPVLIRGPGPAGP